MTSYSYANDFFDFVDQSSGRSAAAFLSKMLPTLKPASVLDIGCGRGVWLAAWQKLGVQDIQGVDGAYVDRNRLHIPAPQFQAADIGQPLELSRPFDLVECLEVGEHLPEGRADQLVANIVRHGQMILFSAAIPGQGGEHHVNEQPIRYWADKFRGHGFRVFDWPRQQVQGLTQIEPWYRYNTLLYVHADKVGSLAPAILATEIKAGEPIPEHAPLLWQARCAVLRCLPAPVIHRLAQIKHRLMTRRAA
jgi:SAM-dependent methyltransferase